MLSLARGLKAKAPLCFAFDLSIRISKPQYEENFYETSTETTENELVRIDWDT